MERSRNGPLVSSDPDRVTVTVSPGDTDTLDDPPTDATHTALISVEGAGTLGLRLFHPGGAEHPVIIGFWKPEAATDGTKQ